jgi:hypothetical protein
MFRTETLKQVQGDKRHFSTSCKVIPFIYHHLTFPSFLSLVPTKPPLDKGRIRRGERSNK